ncbi:MAG TPA: hypothetical protein VGO10_13390 [Baekduia sp.]|jgi:hypothetical protein|nr:hypothetical protein [Baekduia sp.]
MSFTSADVSTYTTVSGTLTALLLQRSGAGVAHGTWRMADLAEHLVKVAGR